MDIQRINSLLSLEPTLKRTEAAPQGQEIGASFAEMLGKALQQVEQDQKVANEMAVKLATGEINDIAQVMIASERANLSLGMAIQVRNKVIEAYQEIMRMPL
ncbi:MAG: flagellar hook-basal body complex protein FliE [Bacillota bacterium]